MKYLKIYNKLDSEQYALVHISSLEQMDIIDMLTEFGYIDYEELLFNEPIDFREI